jgi:hypothetical protein
MSAHIATIEVPPDHWPVPSPYARAIATLRERCPDYVEEERWRQCIADAEGFIAGWDEQAAALGWTEGNLFGLHEPPAEPHPSYQRLSRRDCIGLVWLLQGTPVVALTADAAAIETADRTSRLMYYGATSAVPAFMSSGGSRSTTSSTTAEDEGNAPDQALLLERPTRRALLQPHGRSRLRLRHRLAQHPARRRYCRGAAQSRLHQSHARARRRRRRGARTVRGVLYF